MAAPNRWAVREAAEVTFFDLVTEDAIVTLKTLKMTEVQTSGETVYARGGRGNAKLVGFTSDREATVTVQDAIFDNLALAMLTGNDITEGSFEINMIHEFMIPDESPYTVTLPQDEIESIKTIYILDSDGVTNKIKLAEAETTPDAGEFVIAGNVLTFNVAEAGLRGRAYYTVKTDATAKKVQVTSDMFGGSFKVVADVMVRDESTKKDYFAQFIIPNAKIEDDFSFNFAPEGDPSVLDIPLEILKDPAGNTMWELVIYDEALVGQGEGE